MTNANPVIMEITYLETSEPGFRWMRTYYNQNPQLDYDKAIASLVRAEAVLKDHPFSGRLFEDYEHVRQYQIGNTAFALLYTVARETIWIIDVRDTRGRRSVDVLRAFNDKLRDSYGL